MALYCQLPAHRGLNLIARTPVLKFGVRRRLASCSTAVGWPVFPKPDGVMGVNHNLPRFHQSRHACGVTGVFHKHQEGGGVGTNPRDERYRWQWRSCRTRVRHSEYSFRRYPLSAMSSQTRWSGCWGQIRRAAQQLRQDWANRIKGVLRCLTGGDFGRVRLQVFNQRLRFLFPVLR